MRKILFLLMILGLGLSSCKDTLVLEDNFNTDLVSAFEEVQRSSIKRDINYSPNWQERIEFEDSFYIPLNTDKRIYSYTPDSIKYSLVGKIWLKANKQGENWNFTKLTVLPNDINDSKNSGLLIYEDWKTGESSYEGYIENKLFSPITYNLNPKMKAYNKKARADPDIPCLMISYTVCAGDDDYTSCTTRYQSMRNCVGSGGGNTGQYGGGGNTPPITGGGSGNGALVLVVEAPEAKIDLEELLDCFKNVPDNSNTKYKIALHVDIPDNGNPMKDIANGNAGHAYITLTKTNGNQSHNLSFGFYPISSTKSITDFYMNSIIVDESSIETRESNISISMDDLNSSQFNSLIKTANDLSKFHYSLTQNNCVDFSLNIFNSIRSSNNQIVIPNSNYGIINIGKTPAATYRKLNSMSSDNKSKINKTLQKPVSSGGC